MEVGIVEKQEMVPVGAQLMMRPCQQHGFKSRLEHMEGGTELVVKGTELSWKHTFQDAFNCRFSQC